MSRILIAEDERLIAQIVEGDLRADGHATTHAQDGETALMLARGDGFDLVVLDIGLPRLDGFTVLRRLRGEGVSTPVIVLTARAEARDKVAGLEVGANDYITKPFEVSELRARVRLRLHDEPPTGESSSLRVRDLALDLRTRRVEVSGRSHDLSAREAALLEELLRNTGQVLSREQLLCRVWGSDFDPSSNVVGVLVRALGNKIGAERIETVRGAGYRLR